MSEFLFDAAEGDVVRFEAKNDESHRRPIESSLHAAEGRVVDVGEEDAFAGITIRYVAIDFDGTVYTVSSDDGENVMVQTEGGCYEMNCGVERFTVVGDNS